MLKQVKSSTFWREIRNHGAPRDTKETQFISTTTAIDGAIMLACLSFCGVFQHFQKPVTFDLKCTLKKYVYFGPRWQQKSKIFTAEILSASADANFEKLLWKMLNS